MGNNRDGKLRPDVNLRVGDSSNLQALVFLQPGVGTPEK